MGFSNCREWTGQWSRASNLGHSNSPLFDIMQQDGFLAMVQCTMTLYKKDNVGFAMMDDTDLRILGQINATRTAEKMQGSVTNWEGLLRATWGALVLDKCFWYLINQQWDKDHWCYAMVHKVPVHIQVVDATGQLMSWTLWSSIDSGGMHCSQWEFTNGIQLPTLSSKGVAMQNVQG